MKRALAHALAMMVVTGLAACARPASSPETAYRQFVEAAARAARTGAGDAEHAFAALSTDTQAILQQRTKAAVTASGGSVRDSPALFAFRPGEPPPPVTGVRVVQVSEDRAVLAVTAGGRTEDVQMVKEGLHWRVDLTQRLTK